jgi:hypothetical protein
LVTAVAKLKVIESGVSAGKLGTAIQRKLMEYLFEDRRIFGTTLC